MTGCVLYLISRLLLRTLGQAPFQDPRRHTNWDLRESYLTLLGLLFVGLVDSALFLDLQFHHPVYRELISDSISVFLTGEDRAIERYKARPGKDIEARL